MSQDELLTAPSTESIELPTSLLAVLQRAARQLITHDAASGRWEVDPRIAFPVCIALEQYDWARADALYGELRAAVADWNDIQGDRAVDIPIP